MWIRVRSECARPELIRRPASTGGLNGCRSYGRRCGSEFRQIIEWERKGTTLASVDIGADETHRVGADRSLGRDRTRKTQNRCYGGEWAHEDGLSKAYKFLVKQGKLKITVFLTFYCFSD